MSTKGPRDPNNNADDEIIPGAQDQQGFAPPPPPPPPPLSGATDAPEAPVIKKGIQQDKQVEALIEKAKALGEHLAETYAEDGNTLNKEIAKVEKEYRKQRLPILISSYDLKKPINFVDSMIQLWQDSADLNEKSISELTDGGNAATVFKLLSKAPELQDQLVSYFEAVAIQKHNDSVRIALERLQDSAMNQISAHKKETQSLIQEQKNKIADLSDPETLALLELSLLEAQRNIEALQVGQAELEVASAHMLQQLETQKEQVDLFLKRYTTAASSSPGGQHKEALTVFDSITKKITEHKSQRAQKDSDSTQKPLDAKQVLALTKFIKKFTSSPDKNLALMMFLETNGDRISDRLYMSQDNITDRLIGCVTINPALTPPLKLEELAGVLAGAYTRTKGYLFNPLKALDNTNLDRNKLKYTEAVLNAMMDALKIENRVKIDIASLGSNIAASSSSPSIASGSSNAPPTAVTFSGASQLKKTKAKAKIETNPETTIPADQAKGPEAFTALEALKLQKEKAAAVEQRQHYEEGRAGTLNMRIQELAEETLAEATANHRELREEDQRTIQSLLANEEFRDNPQLQQRVQVYEQRVQKLEAKNKDLEHKLDIAQQAAQVAVRLSGRTPEDVVKHMPTQEGLIAAARLWREQHDNLPIDTYVLVPLAANANNQFLDIMGAMGEANKDDPSKKLKF